MLPVSSRATRAQGRPARRGGESRTGDAEPSTEPETDAAGALASTRDQVVDATASEATHPVQRVAGRLHLECGPEVVLLHRRSTPRVKPHVDHIAISPSGVWIVHSRVARGRVATRKPMFGEPKLTIGGRERTDLLVNLERQVGYVRLALGREHADVQVRSAICFIDTPLPLVRTLHLGSYLFFGTEDLAAHLRSDGPLAPERLAHLATLLDGRFPPVAASSD